MYKRQGYITGLSKIARVVDVFSHRLQVQERMTLQIKECIQETLNPLGVMVAVSYTHLFVHDEYHFIGCTGGFGGYPCRG